MEFVKTVGVPAALLFYVLYRLEGKLTELVTLVAVLVQQHNVLLTK